MTHGLPRTGPNLSSGRPRPFIQLRKLTSYYFSITSLFSTSLVCLQILSFGSRKFFGALLESLYSNVLIIFKVISVLQWFGLMPTSSKSIAGVLQHYRSVFFCLPATSSGCSFPYQGPRRKALILQCSHIFQCQEERKNSVYCTTPLPLIQPGPFARTPTGAQILGPSYDHRRRGSLEITCFHAQL